MCEKKCLIVLGVLSILLSQTGSALSDEVLKTADQLMDLGSSDEAITEYKRFLFFNPQSEDTGYALYKLGLAYRANYDWQEAIEAFESSISAAKTPEIADQRRIVLGTTLIASGNQSLARLQLLEVSEFSEYPSLRQEALYFGGIASLYMFDWDAAGDSFGKFYSGHADHRVKEIDSLLLEARRSHKSVRLANALSAIIPGAGQIYAGNWRNGLNALTLNGLIAGLLVNAIYRKDYTDSALISSLLIRYYRGNIYHAETSVTAYNESADRRSMLEILQIVGEDDPSRLQGANER